MITVSDDYSVGGVLNFGSETDSTVQSMLLDLAKYGTPTVFECEGSMKGKWYCALKYDCRDGITIIIKSEFGKVGLKEAILQCKEQLVKYLTEDKP